MARNAYGGYCRECGRWTPPGFGHFERRGRRWLVHCVECASGRNWHCSCYDWPEVDWDATYYEEDELLKIADMRKRNPSDSAERRFFMLVEQALGAHQ